VLDFRILGPLEVVGDEGAVRLGGPKQRATLAILLLDANRVVSVERLADDLYAGAVPVTAVTQVQRQISDLRKALPEALIETKAPGYVIHVDPGQLDVTRFERWTGEAAQLLARGEAARAAELLRRALALRRGPPLADLAYESFALTSVERLDEIQLAALELRIDADLDLGRHAEVVGELDQLTVEHPARERLRAQLMLALYRSGRQTEALEVYRRMRKALRDEFGIEPTPALRRLERAILTHDPALSLAPAAESERAVLVLASADAILGGLLTVAEPLARGPGRELILARLLEDAGALRASAVALNAHRASLSVAARTAAFTTDDLVVDAVRLATTYDVDLVLLDLTPTGLSDRLVGILQGSPADVALVAGAIDPAHGDGVFVPFGGGEHDWAALELGAWLAAAVRAPLRLVGTAADPRGGRRDASKLLADAALSVQRVAGVETEPLLVGAGDAALAAAVESASVVVVGISPRWRHEGIGNRRAVLVGRIPPPVVIVHRGPRPGGLAPGESRTRFTWSIER